jgi:hypothetical protein
LLNLSFGLVVRRLGLLLPMILKPADHGIVRRLGDIIALLAAAGAQGRRDEDHDRKTDKEDENDAAHGGLSPFQCAALETGFGAGGGGAAGRIVQRQSII